LKRAANTLIFSCLIVPFLSDGVFQNSVCFIEKCVNAYNGEVRGEERDNKKLR
jgi:hypothetical protein